MTILILFIFLIIALALLLLKKSKACATALVLGLIWLLLTGSGLLPSLLLTSLQAPFIPSTAPIWKDKNAIVLLGTGTVRLPTTSQVEPTILAYSRIYKAASLYFACRDNRKQCRVIVSGGDALHTGEPEAEVYRKTLLELKVNAQDIETESNSLNTYKNAEFTSAILKKQQFDQVILVTSGFHLKRAMLYFSHFGIHGIPVFADYLSSRFSITPSTYNFILTDFAIHEYTGIMRFYFYEWMGWNSGSAGGS